MVWQREALGFSLQKVARSLGVDPSTASRVTSLFKPMGSVEKRPYPKDCQPKKKLSKTVQLAVLHSVLQRPGIYLRELQTEVFVLIGYMSVFLHFALFYVSPTLHAKGCGL